jgi:hypothetical protein
MPFRIQTDPYQIDTAQQRLDEQKALAQRMIMQLWAPIHTTLRWAVIWCRFCQSHPTSSAPHPTVSLGRSEVLSQVAN